MSDHLYTRIFLILLWTSCDLLPALVDNSPRVARISACFISKDTDCLCSGLPFQGRLFNQQLWQEVSTSGARGRLLMAFNGKLSPRRARAGFTCFKPLPSSRRQRGALCSEILSGDITHCFCRCGLPLPTTVREWEWELLTGVRKCWHFSYCSCRE